MSVAYEDRHFHFNDADSDKEILLRIAELQRDLSLIHIDYLQAPIETMGLQTNESISKRLEEIRNKLGKLTEYINKINKKKYVS